MPITRRHLRRQFALKSSEWRRDPVSCGSTGTGVRAEAATNGLADDGTVRRIRARGGRRDIGNIAAIATGSTKGTGDKQDT
jgi:hypothetical protein